jgi:VWFA-related protein
VTKHLATLCLLAAAVAAPALAAPDQKFGETTAVVAVEVPVQVTVDGEPVRGLTADNFEVYEGRRKRPLTGFEVIDLVTLDTPAAAAAAAGPMRRHFLMLFDLSNSEPSALVRARKAATELVLNDLHRSDLVAVATYHESKGPQLVLNFTSDRPQIELALDTLGAPQLVDRSPDPLALVVADLEKAAAGGGRGAGAQEEALLETMRDYARLSERAQRENQAGRVTAMTRSLGDLARLMSVVDGRKYVVYLSQGFDNRLLVGGTGEDPADDLATARAAESGEIWNIDNEARFGSGRVQNRLEGMLEEFRRADCVVQSGDIGGLRAGGDQRPASAGRDSLVAMAKDTGGDFYANFNDLGDAMQQMLRRTSVTYVLVFQPEDLDMDGKFHRLEVKLKNVPRGARLSHRPGYYAPKPFEQTTVAERQMATAGEVLAGQEGGQLEMAVVAAPFRLGGAKAYVPVLIEVSGASLLRQPAGDVLATEIYAYAINAEGGIADYVVQQLGLEVAKVTAALRQSGLKFYGHFDLAPGDYNLRVLVRNAKTGASGLRVLPLTVPAMTADAPELLPPLFPEPPGRWLMTRESEQPGERQVPYPFMLKEEPYIPAARPVVAGGGEVKLVLAGYRLGAQAPVFAVRVERAEGGAVAGGGGAVTVLERLPAGAGGEERLLASFKPQGLPPGEYTLRVALDSPAGRLESGPASFVVAGGAAAGSGG